MSIFNNICDYFKVGNGFLCFSDERNEVNSLMLSIMQLNKLEERLQHPQKYALTLLMLKTLLKMCHIKPSN